MKPNHVVEAGGVAYPIRFGQNALYLLEQELMAVEGKSIKAGHPAKTVKVRVDGIEIETPVNGLDLLKTVPNSLAMHLMFWAGLEAARIKLNTRSSPYTIAEAGDIIDEAGGVERITLPVMRAYADAFPHKMSKESLQQIDDLDASQRAALKEKESKNGQEEPSSIGKPASSKRSRRA